MIRHWWRRMCAWWQRPVQVELPFHCAYYGEPCDYVPTGNFYGRCRKCGVDYEPVNDR